MAKTENKFGRATGVNPDVPTDIWDGASGDNPQPVWVAPTRSRVHVISSDNGDDTRGRAGARKVKVYGLEDWKSPEVCETVSMSGSNGTATLKSYVIIYRIEVISYGASGPNVGTIRAVASRDDTTTAMVLPGEGQTQMAIYGVPAGWVAEMAQFYGSCNKSDKILSVNLTLLSNQVPDKSQGFATKHTMGLNTGGTSTHTHTYPVPKQFPGPCIIKMQATSIFDDTDVSAGFDLTLKRSKK